MRIASRRDTSHARRMSVESTLKAMERVTVFPARALRILSKRNPRLTKEICLEGVDILLRDVSVERVEVAVMLMAIAIGVEGKSRRAKSDDYLRERCLRDLERL